MDTGVGKYKSGFLKYVLHPICVSKIVTEFIQCINHYDTLENMKDRLILMMQEPSIQKEIDFFVLKLVKLPYKIDFVDNLYKAMFELPSNLSVRTKQNLPNAPKHVNTRKLLSLETIYVLDAIHKGVTKENIRHILLSNLVIAKQRGKRTAEGIYAKDACEKALQRIDKMDQANIKDFAKNCKIPQGSHVAYEFAGINLHHAIYLKDNIMIEMRVFREKRATKCSIHLTNVYDFLQRVRNSPSPLYQFVYDKEHDLDFVIGRALWCLGLFEYDVAKSNCESFAQWVFTGNFDPPMSYLPCGGSLSKSREVVAYIS